MNTIENVYTTKACKYRLADIKQALYQHRDEKHACLILFDSVYRRLEITEIRQTLHPYFNEDQYILVGVAENKSKAQELLMVIFEDVIAKTGTPDAVKFFGGTVNSEERENNS